MSIECPYCKNYGYLHELELEYKKNDGVDTSEWIWRSYRCQDSRHSPQPTTLFQTLTHIPTTIFFTVISKPFEIITNVAHMIQSHIYTK